MKTITITLLVALAALLQGCKQSRASRASELQAETDRAMDELTNRADYSFPEVELALRRTLSLRTFRIPQLVADSKDEYWTQVQIGDRTVIGQPVHTEREFISLTRGIRASDIVYSYHSEKDGFSGGLDLSPTEIHGWKFNDPDPEIDGNVVVLATAETSEGAPARIVLAPRIRKKVSDAKR